MSCGPVPEGRHLHGRPHLTIVISARSTEWEGFAWLVRNLPAGFAIQEDFTKIKRLDERKWRIPNHAAKSGHVTLEKGGLHFTGTTFIVSEQLFSASSGNEIIINIAASGTGKGYAGICGYQQLPGETRKEIACQNQIFELKEQADNYRRLYLSKMRKMRR